VRVSSEAGVYPGVAEAECGLRFRIARMGYPLARAFQKRFARDPMAAMQRTVACR